MSTIKELESEILGLRYHWQACQRHAKRLGESRDRQMARAEAAEKRVKELGDELHQVRGKNVRMWGRLGAAMGTGDRTPEEFAELFLANKRDREAKDD